MIIIRNPHVTEVWLKTDKKSTKDAQLRACRERRERRERHDEPDDTTAARGGEGWHSLVLGLCELQCRTRISFLRQVLRIFCGAAPPVFLLTSVVQEVH